MKYIYIMKTIFFSAFLFASLLAQGQVFSSYNGKEYGLSSFDNRVPLKHCYRWISTAEMKKWKKGKAYMAKYPQDMSLKRASEQADKVIFCWSNPVTGKMGGLFEDYGDHLLRIDLDPNAMTFDRNQNKYFRSEIEVTEGDPEKKGVGTNLVYANYTVNSLPFFQEYMIRSDSIIVGWTFADDFLRNEFSTQFERLQAKQLQLSEFHHFYNSVENKNKTFFEEQGFPYYLSRVREAFQNVVQKDWADPSLNQYFIGPAGARVCPAQPNCLAEQNNK